MQASASEIFQKFQAEGLFSERIGPDNRCYEIAPIESVRAGALVFLSKTKQAEQVRQSNPAIVIADAESARILSADSTIAVLVTENVNLAQALVKQAYVDRDLRNSEFGRIHPSAVLHESLKVPDSVSIGPQCVVGRDVRLGESVVLMAGVIVESGAEIGDNSVLHPRAVVGYDCRIGRNCIIKAGAVIGSEGFGFAQDKARKHHRIPQTGTVIIEDNCVIGANNCIDRAAYQATIIRSGVIFDNLCHIAHNCEIGEDSIIIAFTGVAGSSKVGKRCVLSGQCGVLDHIHIADDAILLHRPAVVANVDKGGVYAGQPLTPINDYLRNQSGLRKIHETMRRIREIEKRIDSIEATKA